MPSTSSALIDFTEAAYDLGLSKARVSALMASATRKLGAHTRVELIKKIQDFGPLS